MNRAPTELLRDLMEVQIMKHLQQEGDFKNFTTTVMTYSKFVLYTN